MSGQEIKDLIASKIAGQGNQVDIGNALPEILDAIISAIPTNSDRGPILYDSPYSLGQTFPDTEVSKIGNAFYLRLHDSDTVYPKTTVYSSGWFDLHGIANEYGLQSVSIAAVYGTFIIDNGDLEGGSGVLIFYGKDSNNNYIYGSYGVEM